MICGKISVVQVVYFSVVDRVVAKNSHKPLKTQES